MVVYTCNCLNVQVFGQQHQEQLEAESLQNCPLGENGVVIELIDPGFNFIHKCLVHRQRNEPWTVYICVPCHMRTHAVNVRANLLVVNSGLVVGEEVVAAMKKKPEYSKVFNLFLNAPGVKHDEGMELQSHDDLQKQLHDLQAILCCYVKDEEEAMERRIKKYEQEQRAMLDKITDEARRDKTSLVSILFHNSERSERHTGAGKTQGKSAHVYLSHSKSAGEYVRDNVAHNSLSRDKNPHRMRDSSPDVFAMEEFDIDDAFDNNNFRGLSLMERSDNHVRSERDPSPEQSRHSRSSLAPQEGEGGDASFMSTSVPISMPATHLRNLKKTSALDDDIEEIAEFADIPRQMQQLSESIQERDRYIFGDRPRQRLHTGDFTQVKWNS